MKEKKLQFHKLQEDFIKEKEKCVFTWTMDIPTAFIEREAWKLLLWAMLGDKYEKNNQKVDN